MFLSCLTINAEHLGGARAVAEPYLMHQLVWSAFPNREEGGAGRVLYRIEPLRRSRLPVVLVQSERGPDWSKPLASSILLSAPHKAVRLLLRPGQVLRFHLRANPTMRRSAGVGKQGTRVGVYGEEEQRAWLARKGERNGFAVHECRVVDGGIQLCRRAAGIPPLRHLSADFDGLLEVTDPEQMVNAVASGIGSGKAFGFGLLSLARV
jgi:CRISPR system Cascade subunit CasE